MGFYDLRLDAAAVARANTLLPLVQAAYALYIAANPHVTPVTIDINYVYTSSVGVGLNIWRAPTLWASYPMGPGPDVPTAATFTPHAGTGTTTVFTLVSDYDAGRAIAIRTSLLDVPTITAVIGCALCTGLARLLGVYPIQGPFT